MMGMRTLFTPWMTPVVAALVAVSLPALADEASDEGWIDLFNGEDLSGWTGTEGYKVEDGILICTPEGKLMRTEEEYDNFIVELEVKFTPGANNGLGIRDPGEGNPAFDGMEIQILDNTHEKYANLAAYQYHGSVYGIIPADVDKTEYKPMGEWNFMRVTANGPHIKVEFNGEVIVDADISDVEPLSGHDHPGQHRESGHIVLMGHNDHIEFRTVRLKPLE